MNRRMSGPRLLTGDLVADAARWFLDELVPVLEAMCPGEDDKPLELPAPFSSWVPEEQLGHRMRLYRSTRFAARVTY
jgi:hypothetical protein